MRFDKRIHHYFVNNKFRTIFLGIIAFILIYWNWLPWIYNKFKNREKPFSKKLRRWVLGENNEPFSTITEQVILDHELEEVNKTA